MATAISKTEVKMEEPETLTQEIGKTFTQADVDAIVSKRVARAMRGVPSDDELNDYRRWKENQETEANALSSLKTERDALSGKLSAAESERDALRRELYVANKGFSGEEAEFIAFKAAKMVNETKTFEQAVDEIAQTKERKPKLDWAAPISGQPAKQDAATAMNALIRGAWK